MKIKKIPVDPVETLYYVVDSNFFANKYLRPSDGANIVDQNRIRNSNEWWEVIDWQIRENKAICYVNDLCIAETFKIIAKKYYQERVFGSNRYQGIKKRISSDLTITSKQLAAKKRFIGYHNLLVDRDIIIGVSRFLEIAHRNNLGGISIIDLTILSSAKYLIDFFRIKKEQIIILSGDNKLLKCSRRIDDCPTGVDPLDPKNDYQKFFN